ncbi:MAG: hypothetical protein ACU0CO_10340 [Shimia sp.]
MSATKTLTKESYEVQADGWIAGQKRLKGAVVELTPAAAKYENVKPLAQPKPHRKTPAKDTAKDADK